MNTNANARRSDGYVHSIRYVANGRGNHWLTVDGTDFAAILDQGTQGIRPGAVITYVACSESENRCRRAALGYSPLGAIRFIDVLTVKQTIEGAE